MDEQDEPSSSNISVTKEDEDDSKALLVSKKRTQKFRKFIGSKIILKNRNYLAKNLKTLVKECESRIRGFRRKQRAHKGTELANMDNDDAYDADKSSSISSSSDEGDIDENEQADVNILEYIPKSNLKRYYKKEQSSMGQWLVLSFVKDGWSFEEVKKFFHDEYGLKCVRSVIRRDRTRVQEFKAVIKLNSTEELNQVVENLKSKRIDKFIYLSFDKEIIHDTLENETSREEPLVPKSEDI